MKQCEEILLILLKTYKDDNNATAGILQSYIQTNGPVSDECGEKVKEIIGGFNYARIFKN